MARRYALVIGVSEYQRPLPPLSRPAKDAEAVAKVLRDYGNFESLKLLNETKVNGRRALGWVSHSELDQVLTQFLEQQAANQDALIYFTGHGFLVEESLDDQRGYLATSDCRVEFESGRIVTQRRGFSFHRLDNLIQRANLSSLVLLLDCCHSGSYLEQNLIKRTLTTFTTRQDYCLITACRWFEQAYAETDQEHSIFTGALLEGLTVKNANKDGNVTGDSLAAFIKPSLKRSGQEPLSMGYGGLITVVSYQPESKVIKAIVDESGEPICPYQGLQAFTAAQREFFFGRQRVIEEIRRRLEEKPFVPIIGASGSGKSSIVRAGLIPWLEETGWTVLAPIKPGYEPLAALRTVFEPFFPRSTREIQHLHQLIQREPNPLPVLINRLSSASSVGEQSDRFLLVVDQFEELFTLCADESDRQRFIDLITQVVDLDDVRLAVVITMRADFLEPCLRYPKLLQLLETPKNLASPTGIDLRDVIVKPAQRQGYDIEEPLLFQIQEDVGKEPGFLPLLEFALTKLWENRDRERKLLTLEQYENLGGLTGALNLHAEQVYHYRDFERELPTDRRSEQEQEWIKRVFLRLVRTGEAEKDTRQCRSKSELLAIADADSDAQDLLRGLIENEGGLVQGRLLVTGQEQANSTSWVDLAHEALLDGWNRFAEWRKNDREVRRLADRVHDEFKAWKTHCQDDDFLVSGGLLIQIHKKRLELELYLSGEELEFYQLSYKNQLRKTSYEQEANQVKQQLQELQIKVVSKMNQPSDDTLSLAEFNQKLNDHVEELQLYETRRRSSQLMAEWLIENQEMFVEVIVNYIFSQPAESNETNFRLQELNKYINWLYNSLLATQPNHEELEAPSSLSPTLYAQAFNFLKQELPAEEPSKDAREEFDLYLDYLISYFNTLN